MSYAAFAIVCLVALQQVPPSEPIAPVAPPEPLRPQVTATVNLDPERPARVDGWWSNGTQLLEVAPDGAYRLYGTQSRYSKPVEVGRWHRQNYGVFWLDPYTARKEARTRVPLSKVDDALMISVRNFSAMTHLDAPPISEEDFVLGLWVGDGGSLDLQPSMRYRFVAPQRPTEGQPVVISSHRGAWRLRDGRVELVPDSPSVATLLFEPIRDSEGTPYMRLRGVEGTLDRVIERAAQPPIPPVAQPTPTSTNSPTATPTPIPSG